MHKWKSELAPFLESLKLDRGASPHTLSAYASDIRGWFLELPEVYTPTEISITLEKWRKKGQTPRTAARKLTALRQYLLFCLRESRGAAAECEAWITALPSLRYPKNIPDPLTHQDLHLLIEHVLSRAEAGEKEGLRNHALVLLLYGAGLRVSELVQLRLGQIDWVHSSVRVLGKGSKERLIPLADPAREALRLLIEKQQTTAEDPIFCGPRGTMLTRQGVWDILKRIGLEAGVSRAFSPHSLRHAFATHLLAGGMNLRHLQQLLGHSSIAATEVYTHVENAQLQETHRKHHPRG